MRFNTLYLVAATSVMALAWPGAGTAQTTAMSPPPVPLPSVQTADATQTAQAAAPQPPPSPAPARILDEMKVGLLAHDIGFLGHHKESGLDGNVELLFASPDFLKYIWSPRPHLGADLNDNGNTSNYYFGLTWGGVFYSPNWSRDDGFFAYLGVGGSVNDGRIFTHDPTRKSLGSHELFHEGLDIGYRLNRVISVSGFIDHISNADLATHNQGITNGGARVGFKF
jgi:lipid A 3-O-deacylase